MEEPSDRSKRGKIFVFSAASGAGKTTLLDYLRQTVPGLVYSISATTRPPRAGEKDSVHYFFLTENEFGKKLKAGEFAEWAVVHGHFYGTPRSFIDDTIASGKHIIMDIDVMGKKKFDSCVSGYSRHSAASAVDGCTAPASRKTRHRFQRRDRPQDSQRSKGNGFCKGKREI